MSTPNYVIELMPTDVLISHAKALQDERKELTARIKELEAALDKCQVDYAGKVYEARSLPEGLVPLETVQYWVEAYSKDPYNLGGGMIVKLLQEYLQLRLAASPKPEGVDK